MGIDSFGEIMSLQEFLKGTLADFKFDCNIYPPHTFRPFRYVLNLVIVTHFLPEVILRLWW